MFAMIRGHSSHCRVVREGHIELICKVGMLATIQSEMPHGKDGGLEQLSQNQP